MKSLLLQSLLGLVSLGTASQPSTPEPIPVPLRDLKFGTLNFLHTTDTHGWHAGHLLEASYSADWGDYIDFASRLREKIEAEGNDLVVVDTGDRIEGNGLYDASEPKGKYTFEIFKQQHIDIITTGNHELYKQNSSENELNILVPAYGDAYIASNLDIVNPATGKIQPLAHRFRKLTTKNQNIRILAFGLIFNFDRNANNTKVQPVELMVLEPWFQQAIKDQDIDLIVVTAHAAARSDELIVVYKAIRAVHPDLPIQMFAGHQHIRDYKKFDDKAYALASGRFMETIGFQSIDGIKPRGKDYESISTDTATPTWFRRYINNNLYSYYHHSGTNATTFHSKHGRTVSKEITDARKALKLDKKFGCAPMDYWMSRVPFPSPTSIYTWLNETVLPEAVINKARKDRARLVLANTGGIRFDILKGPFTTDSALIISPFTSGMNYIKDVPLATANLVVELLNRAPQILQDQAHNEKYHLWRLAPPQQRFRTSDFIPTQDHSMTEHNQHNPSNQIPLSQSQPNPRLKMIPGYTTTDDGGNTGDDTIHAAIPTYLSPNVISAYTPSNTTSSSGAEAGADPVDLIFNSFLNPYIILALRFAQVNYTAQDIGQYLPGESMTDVIARWVRGNWNLDC